MSRLFSSTLRTIPTTSIRPHGSNNHTFRNPFTVTGFYSTRQATFSTWTRWTSHSFHNQSSNSSWTLLRARLFRTQQRRAFQSTPPRKDVFFVSVPAIKSSLLALTRGALLILPFWYRWRLSQRFPKAGRLLWTIPLFTICVIVAIGMDQSPRTARWRLLLMSEREEMEWSQKRFEDLLDKESLLIIPGTDPRVQTVKRVSERLIAALEEDSPVACAVIWPREVSDINERIRKLQNRLSIVPSAITDVALLPFRPETSNPEKVFSRDWDIFVMDLPKLNAYVLPTKELVVYSGLLSMLEDDEPLLAAVLAHEICHVTERHAVENQGFLALSRVVFDIARGVTWAFTMSFPVVSDALAGVFNFLDGVIAERAYSRRLETEADTLGLEVMARAGYDPRAAHDLWQILNELEQEAKEHQGEDQNPFEKMPFLRTHPTGEQRIKDIERNLPKAMEIYNRVRKQPGKKNLENEQWKPSSSSEIIDKASREIRDER